MKHLVINITVVIMLVVPTGNVLATGDANAGQTKSMICSTCHGTNGNSINSQYPSLAGQVPGYIAKQLHKFKSGVRSNPIMGGIVQALTEDDIVNLDAWYSSQQPSTYTISEDQLETAKLGEKVYRGGYPPMKVPACMGCHGPSGAGIPPNFPKLAGQHPEQTEAQLLAFKTEQRFSDIMNPIAFRLTTTQIQALALYLSALY